MIIGFLGKGGSGKSTLATAMVKHLYDAENTVLAIDADHNMDLTFNLIPHVDADIPYIGRSMQDLRLASGLDANEEYASVFLRDKKVPSFSLASPDEYTKKWSIEIYPRMRLMTAGSHTEGILHGGGCSHTLFTPLKVYLPLLELPEKHYVVVDEKAGTDSVGTGITTGFDFVFVCVEPTSHGIKAAQQIANLLDFFETPHAFVWNKIKNKEDERMLKNALEDKPSFIFKYRTDLSGAAQANEQVVLQDMCTYAQEITKSNANRFARTQRKFERNERYNTN